MQVENKIYKIQMIFLVFLSIQWSCFNIFLTENCRYYYAQLANLKEVTVKMFKIVKKHLDI